MAKGIKFQSQVSTPLGSDTGLWVNSAQELVLQRNGYPAQNITSLLSGGLSAGPYLSNSFLNNSGATIPAGTPVSINASGELSTVNVATTQLALNVVGVTKNSIPNSAVGEVVITGVLDNISTAIAVGSAIFVSKTGGLTATYPVNGVGGFVAGDYAIRLGTLFKNASNPSQKDLLINIAVIAQLS